MACGSVKWCIYNSQVDFEKKRIITSDTVTL